MITYQTKVTYTLTNTNTGENHVTSNVLILAALDATVAATAALETIKFDKRDFETVTNIQLLVATHERGNK
jgi:hypothetical protein